MADQALLTQLVEYAKANGYTVVIDDISPDPNLVFVRGSDGLTYSISVERIL